MSLVVAEATDDGPRIVSDTRVTLPFGQRSNFKTGTLKTIAITREVTISFAGDVDVGLHAVRGFARELKQGRAVANLLPALQELASDDTVEFIVATGDASSQLTRIRKRGIERSIPYAWVGDQDGFERFQQARNAPLNPVWDTVLSPPEKAKMRFRLAMLAVIADPAVASVGDFCVEVVHKVAGFEYLGSTFIHVGRDISVAPGDDLFSKMAQSVGEGGYAVSVVEPAQPGTPALGLNFPRARLGMLYLPLEFDTAQVIADVSPNDFAKAVLDRFGVAMKDPMLRHRGQQ